MHELRKHRARPVGDVFLDNAGRERAVYIYIINSPPKLGNDRRICNAVNVEYRRPRHALAADDGAFDLKSGIGDALSDKRGVGAKGLGEAVLAALERFLHRRLADAALYLLRPQLKAHRAPFVLEYDRAAALRDIADDIVKARAQLRLRAVHRTVEQPLSGYRDSRAQKLGKRPQNIL